MSVDVQVGESRRVNAPFHGVLHSGAASRRGNGVRTFRDEDVIPLRRFGHSLAAQVGCLSAFPINECPNAGGVSIGCAVGAENAEMTVGELPIDFIDPSLDEESLAGARQAVHFNGETGEHPNVVHAHHVLEAETVFSGVHRSAAEEQIAQTSPRKIAQAVLCEGFDGEGITTCAMTHFSVGLNVRWMIMRAKVKVLTQKK